MFCQNLSSIYGSERPIGFHMTCVGRSRVVDYIACYVILNASLWRSWWSFQIILIQYWWEKLVCSLWDIGGSLLCIQGLHLLASSLFEQYDSARNNENSTKERGCNFSSFFENNSIQLINTSWFMYLNHWSE